MIQFRIKYPYEYKLAKRSEITYYCDTTNLHFFYWWSIKIFSPLYHSYATEIIEKLFLKLFRTCTLNLLVLKG